MNITKNNFQSHLPFFIFYLILLITGLFIFQDYGIPWDEPACRSKTGILNINFILNGDYHSLITSDANYHGAVFEIFLVGIERLFGLKNMQDIFLMRHLVIFLFFTLSVLFFYRICNKYLNSKWLSLTGCVFLVLSPRIFADAFYNSKDLVFMSMSIITIFTTLQFLERKNFKTAIYHAIACAILIDIRILGIIIPLFTFLFLFIDFLINSGKRKNTIVVTSVFSVTLVGAVILFWPVLWRDPFGNIILAIKEMSKYPWEGSVLYIGKKIDSSQIPWHYLPWWIIISTPVLYTVLFISGMFYLFRRFIKEKNLKIEEWLNIYIFLITLSAIIFLHSVVYDGWRHAYFIYPSFLIISLIGLNNIIHRFQNFKWIINCIKVTIISYLFFILITMINLHPLENVYFNFFAGRSLAEAREKYDVDYWGLSYKEGLDKILKNDSSSHIIISASELEVAINNSYLFSEKERARISFTETQELSDYFLTCYRYRPYPCSYHGEYEVIKDNGVILSLYDLRKKKLSLSDNKYIYADYINSNENNPENLQSRKRINTSNAFSESYVEWIDSSTTYSSGFSYHPTDALLIGKKKINYLISNFQMKTNTLIDAKIVFQLDSGNGKTYDWESENIQSTLNNTWMNKKYLLRLPEIYSTSDNIKVYIWNCNNNNFYVDDFEVKIYSVPLEEFDLVIKSMPCLN